MKGITELLKEKMNYTSRPAKCGTCKHFTADLTTDNFGPGDLCTRNPDCSFRTGTSAHCDGYESKAG